MDNEKSEKEMKIESVKAELAQIEQQIIAIKQQAAAHLLERDLHDEHYKEARQRLGQMAATGHAKQIELQQLGE